ncbi:MAG: hypothetical protein CR986_00870 [Ignavibacteriae bacterium]|nr:MAG: hypothetical protein CR986_00870 [Ignavibacteriota bacterium]
MLYINTSWLLKSFKIGGKIITPPTNQNYTLNFLKYNRAKGIDDCNNITWSCEVTNHKIKFSPIGGTKLGCNDNSINKLFENALLFSENFIPDEENLVRNNGGSSNFFLLNN